MQEIDRTNQRSQLKQMRQRVRHFLTGSEDGVAAIEFAIIVPIFLVMIFGMINFGYTFFAKHSMQRIAGETIRAVSYGELSVAEAERFARSQMETAFGTFEDGHLTPSVQMAAGGDELTINISAATSNFDLVDFAPVMVSRYTPRIEVELTGKVITRFNPSLGTN